MRPRGEIRQAIGGAAKALADEQGSATWRELAQRACVGFDAARRTVENMARGGELEVAGSVRVEGSRRPMARYAPRTNWATATTGGLGDVMRAWGR